MPTISELLVKIRNAIYGEEVRGSIISAIEKCYTDTENGVTAATNAAANANNAASAAQAAAAQMTDAIDEAHNALVVANQNVRSINKIGTPISAELVNSGVAASTGANTAGHEYYRTGYVTIPGDVLLIPPDGYKLLVWVYSGVNVSSAISSPTDKAYVSTPVAIEKTGSIKYTRLCYKRLDNADMTTDAEDPTSDLSILSSALMFYSMTDHDLTINGAPADAKVVGDKFADIDDRIGTVVYNSTANRVQYTESGITYSCTDGVATATGTATAKFWQTLSGGTTSFPSYITLGKTYYVVLETTGTKNIKFNVTAYIGGTATTLFSSASNGSFTVSADANYDGVLVRYYIPKGTEVDATIHPIIYSKPTVGMLMDQLSELAGSPTKIRIMQNNLGKFNRGQPVNGTKQYLTNANVDTIIANYRKLYNDIEPDILGFEEWEVTRAVRDSTDTTQVTDTINMDTLIYDRLYPSKRTSTGLTSALALKSKYPILSGSKMNRIEFTYEWEGATKSDHFYVLTGTVDVGGKLVKCGVTPFVSSGGENVEKRKAAMPIVLDLFEDDDYAFLICDANHAGNRGSTPGESWEPSAIEGDWLYENIIVPKGFNTVHGSYMPWQMTWESIHNGHRGCVDNIYYKDNGKIVLCGMQVLGDRFSELLSDHVPVIADFLLL